MEKPWIESIWKLKNKCMGRFHTTDRSEIHELCMTQCKVCPLDRKDPFEEIYCVDGLPNMSPNAFKKLKNCIIAFTTEKKYRDDGTPIHWYFTAYGHDSARFVKDFDENSCTLTSDKDEAKHFVSDDECDRCMEYILKKYHPWTIALHNFEGNDSVSASVHYPAEYWGCNGHLQPSLMNKSIAEWHEEHGIEND